MGIYSVRRRRARKKITSSRRRKKDEDEAKKARGKRARPGARVVKKAVRSKRTSKKRTITRKKAAARKRPVSRKKTIDKKRAAISKRTAKRPVVKKRVASRRPVVAKKRATAKKVSKATARKRLSKLQKAQARKLAAIKQLEQKARGQKRGPARKKVREAKEKLEKGRKAQALVTKDLPRSTPDERKKSEVDNSKRIRKRFRDLRRKAREAGQLPKLERVPRRVDNEWNLGDQRQVRIQRVLEPSSVEDILYTIDRRGRTMLGIYPNWHARIVFYGLGDHLLGSGGKALELPVEEIDPDGLFFQTEGYDSSGVWGTYEGMLHALDTLLDHYANLPNTVVYLHHVRLLNFSRKRER